MFKIIKKTLSVILALGLIAAAIPSAVFAVQIDDIEVMEGGGLSEESDTNENEGLDIDGENVQNPSAEDDSLEVPDFNRGNDNQVIPSSNEYLSYRSHVQSIGWMPNVKEGVTSGTTGMGKRLEAFSLNFNTDDHSDSSVSYEAYVQRTGWQGAVSSGNVAGTTGKSLAVQALRVKLTGSIASSHDVYYRVHVSQVGWLGWASNGSIAGTMGYDRAIEAFELIVLPKGETSPGGGEPSLLSVDERLSYQTHVQSIGWQASVSEGETAGTMGAAKRVEALSIDLYDNENSDSTVNYQVYLSNQGWQDAVCSGAQAGTTGRATPLEGVKIWLEGNIENSYDVYYRVHMSKVGWLAWSKNGEVSGTVGCTLNIEAIEILLVSIGGEPPLSSGTQTPFTALYDGQAHSQSNGWLSTVTLGRQVLGTTGSSKRLEAFTLSWNNSSSVEGGIKYRAHVQGTGWQDWVYDGEESGTTGQSKRIEAIGIELTGDMANSFDIYYRVHASHLGWFGWAKNGENAGTTGCALPIEAIEVALVPKNVPAPGNTSGAFFNSVSGDWWLDAQLRRITSLCGNDLRACFNYVSSYPYQTMSLYPQGNWAPPLAKEMVQYGGGNCYRYAALFCMLAQQLGYDAKVVSGSLKLNYGYGAHGWVEIAINNQVYVCDPCLSHSMPYYNWYMITYSNAKVIYVK